MGLASADEETKERVAREDIEIIYLLNVFCKMLQR
jgi:hypothetical protein